MNLITKDNVELKNFMDEKDHNIVQKKMNRLVVTAKIIIGVKYIGTVIFAVLLILLCLIYSKKIISHTNLNGLLINIMAIMSAVVVMVATYLFYKLMKNIFDKYVLEHNEELKDLYSQIIIYGNILGLYTELSENILSIVGIGANRLRVKTFEGKLYKIQMYIELCEDEKNEIRFYNDHVEFLLDAEKYNSLEIMDDRIKKWLAPNQEFIQNTW